MERKYIHATMCVVWLCWRQPCCLSDVVADFCECKVCGLCGAPKFHTLQNAICSLLKIIFQFELRISYFSHLNYLVKANYNLHYVIDKLCWLCYYCCLSLIFSHLIWNFDKWNIRSFHFCRIDSMEFSTISFLSFEIKVKTNQIKNWNRNLDWTLISSDRMH